MFSFLKKDRLISETDQKKVGDAIKQAESATSGEIRVYVEKNCNYEDPLVRAKEIFHELKMERTSARNAILIYLAPGNKKFALFGDIVIYEAAGGALFWQSAADKLKGHLINGAIGEGVVDCIRELGSALAAKFPFDPSVKKNELPDEIVFGK